MTSAHTPVEPIPRDSGWLATYSIILELASSSAPVSNSAPFFSSPRAVSSRALNITPDRFDGNCTSDFARLRAAHPVSHDVQIALRRLDLRLAQVLDRQHRVLVMLAHPADVGQRGRAQSNRAAELDQLGLERVDRRPALGGTESERAANRLLERGDTTCGG